MGVYVISGGATGIGAAVTQQLKGLGHDVLVVDLKSADIVADLSTPQGREQAVQEVKRRAPDGIDGLVPCAGLGPSVKPYSLIARVNYFGALALVEGLLPLLAMRQGAVVMVSSNSASMPGLDPGYIELLLAGDETTACERVDSLDGHNAYAGGKHALTRWMRRQSTDFARQQVRINAVAPGITQTPLTDKVLEDPDLGQAMRDFGATVPLGEMGRPAQIADTICFLLGSQASFVHGAVLFVDGGHDAMLRPDQF